MDSLIEMLVNHGENTWATAHNLALREQLAMHEKNARQLDAQFQERLEKMRARHEEERLGIVAEFEKYRAAYDVTRARIVSEWAKETAAAAHGYAAMIQEAVLAAVRQQQEPSVVLLPSSQPEPAQAEPAQAPALPEPENCSGISLGLAYECEQPNNNNKRTYEDVFGEDGADIAYDFDVNQADIDFIDDSIEMGGDEDEEEEEDFIEDDYEDEDEQEEDPVYESEESVVPVQNSRIQPARHAKTHRPPPLLNRVKPRLDTFIATMGHPSKARNIRGKIDSIEAVFREERGSVGEWEKVPSAAQEHMCDFCEEDTRRCTHRIAVNGKMLYCGANCYWSVKPMIKLLELVYDRNRGHTKKAEEEAEQLMDEIMTGSADKRRHYKNDEDDEANDADEIVLVKRRKPKNYQKRIRRSRK